MAERMLTVTLVGDADQLNRTFRGVSSEADRLGQTMRRVGEVAAGFLAANVIGKGLSEFKDLVGGSIDAASSLAESLNAVQQIYGQSAQTILDWGEQNATSFGLSQRAFNEMATPMGAVLKNLGFAQDEVADQTINLTKRAADMASVFNTDVSDALAAINSALRGEANPIERYGVSVNQAAVNLRALADTGKESETALTANEKAAARLAIIFEQTSSVAGDFAATSDGLANAQRIAAARTEELQAEIGAKLLPVMLQVTQAKLKLVEVVADLLVPALATLSEHSEAIGVTIAGVATTITVLMIPRLVALIASTWAYVSALTAQAVAFAVANPLLAAGALAAGAAAIAFFKLTRDTYEVADATQQAADVAEFHRGALNRQADAAAGAAGSVAVLTGAVEDLTFASMLQDIAQKALIYGTGEWDRDLPGNIENLRKLWEQEELLRSITDDLREAVTGERAAQEAASASTRSASEAKREATEASREQAAALAEVNRILEEQARRTQTLAQQFGSLGDSIRQSQFETARGLIGQGVDPGAAVSIAAAQAAAAVEARKEQINAALGAGTIDAGTALRLLNALQRGTPDAVDLALGLVPGLAAGGIVTRPTLALIGEAGPEAVVPLSGRGGGGFGTTVNLTVQTLDARSAGDYLVQLLDELGRSGRISRVTVAGGA